METEPPLPAPGGFVELFADIAATDGARLFAICEDEPLSFGELDRLSGQFASALRTEGAQPGDRIGVMLPNGRAALGMIFAIARSGLVWVPLNVQLVGNGLRHIIGHACPRLVVTTPELAPALEQTGAARIVTPHALLAAPATPLAEAMPAPEADFALCYTSGTTGPPKGVRVSHRMLRLAGEGVLRVADAEDGDVMFMW